MLSASSSHFAGLLAEVTPGQSPLIIVDGPTAHDIAAIVRFIYHGEVSVDQEHLPDLLKTASALKIKGLLEFPIDGPPPSCPVRVASARLEEANPHTSLVDTSYQSKKHKILEANNLLSRKTSNLMHVNELPQENVPEVQHREEILPLNLSCKRRNDEDLSLQTVHYPSNDPRYNSPFPYRESSPPVIARNTGSEISTSIPKLVGDNNENVHDYSREVVATTGRFYEYSVPRKIKYPPSDSKQYYITSDTTPKFELQASPTQSYAPRITHSSNFQQQTSTSWKPSHKIKREPQPLIIDSDKNVYCVPSTYSVITPTTVPTVEYRGPVIKTTLTPTVVLPQPPMKRLRTMECATQKVGQIQNTTRLPSAPVPLVGVSSTPCVTIPNHLFQPSNISSAEINPQQRQPLKKYQEIVSVCPPQIVKTVEATEIRNVAYDSISKPHIIPNYEFIPVKSENANTEEDCKNIKTQMSSPEMMLVQEEVCEVKKELSPLATPSPLQSHEFQSESATQTGGSILSSAFMSPKSSLTATPANTITIPTIKTATFSPTISSSLNPSTCPTTPILSPSDQPLTSNTFTMSPNTLDATHSSKLRESSVVAASDDLPSQSVVTSSNNCQSGVNSYTTASVTTTTATPPGPITAGTPDASGGGSSQRVSINMRTFKVNITRFIWINITPV